MLGADQTSLTSADAKPPLPAGTYYVHIAGHDACTTRVPRSSSRDMMEITIRTVTRSRAASRPRNRRLHAEEDSPAVRWRFRRRRREVQRRDPPGGAAPVLHASRTSTSSGPGADERAGHADREGDRRRGWAAGEDLHVQTQAARKVTGGVLATLPLKISKKQKRALKRAMRRGKRLRARVAVTAMDRAGNTITKHATIRLKP